MRPEEEQNLQLAAEKAVWEHYPEGLGREELLDPYLVLDQFFFDYNLPQYREKLYHWLEQGLSLRSSPETLPAHDLVKVYGNLCKRYQPAWVILNRERKTQIRKPRLMS